MQKFLAIIGTDFMELPTETPLNSGHRFCAMELEYIISFSGFVAIFCFTHSCANSAFIVVTTLVPYDAEHSLSSVPVVQVSCHLFFVK